MLENAINVLYGTYEMLILFFFEMLILFHFSPKMNYNPQNVHNLCVLTD